MTVPVTARAEVVVEATPEDAFHLFTDEISLWWRPHTRYWNDPERGLYLKIEPGVGGRWIEVYDPDSGEGMEVGRVTRWEPPGLLALTWTQVGWPDDLETELELTFEPVPEGTRVRLSHSGFEPLGDEAAATSGGYEAGWREILGWLAEHAASTTQGERR